LSAELYKNNGVRLNGTQLLILNPLFLLSASQKQTSTER
jgi:hypothetical protein